jgi:anti-sigma regulatory factor (Ser/Thr protein kinase)
MQQAMAHTCWFSPHSTGIGRKVMIAQPLTPATDAVGGAGPGMGFHWLKAAVETAALASGNWPLKPDPAPAGWTCFPRVAVRTPGTDPSAVPPAREFAVATMHRWGVAERCGDVAIVVSELLTNALRHALPGPSQARSPRAIRLGLMQPGPCVLCVVADPSRTPPVPRQPGSFAENGRGLHVVGAVSDNWGYALGDLGKVVWAMFSTAPQLARAPSHHDHHREEPCRNGYRRPGPRIT